MVDVVIRKNYELHSVHYAPSLRITSKNWHFLFYLTRLPKMPFMLYSVRLKELTRWPSNTTTPSTKGSHRSIIVVWCEWIIQHAFFRPLYTHVVGRRTTGGGLGVGEKPVAGRVHFSNGWMEYNVFVKKNRHKLETNVRQNDFRDNIWDLQRKNGQITFKPFFDYYFKLFLIKIKIIVLQEILDFLKNNNRQWYVTRTDNIRKNVDDDGKKRPLLGHIFTKIWYADPIPLSLSPYQTKYININISKCSVKEWQHSHVSLAGKIPLVRRKNEIF